MSGGERVIEQRQGRFGAPLEDVNDAEEPERGRVVSVLRQEAAQALESSAHAIAQAALRGSIAPILFRAESGPIRPSTSSRIPVVGGRGGARARTQRATPPGREDVSAREAAEGPDHEAIGGRQARAGSP